MINLCKDVLYEISKYLDSYCIAKENLYDIFVNKNEYSKSDWIYTTRYRRINMLVWLCKNKKNLNNFVSAAREAAINGHLNILKYFVKIKPCYYYLGNDIMDKITKNGHLKMLKYIDKNQYGGYTTNIGKIAVEYGRLKIIKYFHEKRMLYKKDYLLNDAIKHGHISIVKYLHRNNLGNQCCDEGLKNAIKNRRLDIIKYACKNKMIKNSKEISTCAAGYNKLYILKYLYKHGIKNYEYDVNEAILKNSINVLMWLFEIRENYLYSKLTYNNMMECLILNLFE
jgi:hypothetical protein